MDYTFETLRRHMSDNDARVCAENQTHIKFHIQRNCFCSDMPCSCPRGKRVDYSIPTIKIVQEIIDGLGGYTLAPFSRKGFTSPAQTVRFEVVSPFVEYSVSPVVQKRGGEIVGFSADGGNTFVPFNAAIPAISAIEAEETNLYNYAVVVGRVKSSGKTREDFTDAEWSLMCAQGGCIERDTPLYAEIRQRG